MLAELDIHKYILILHLCTCSINTTYTNMANLRFYNSLYFDFVVADKLILPNVLKETS